MDLSDRERISMICSAVLIQYTRVTDRQTNSQVISLSHIKNVRVILL